MADPIPLPKEVQTTLPKVETKPVSAIKPSEQPLKRSEQVTRLKTAHGTLEKIASGTPVAEALAPTESAPSKEAMTELLKEGNALLLELRDMRLWVHAIATQAENTPLGNEVRQDALRGLLKVEAAGLSPEQATQLTHLQEKIKVLNLPEPNPAESATIKILTQYNEQHPDKPIPTDVLESVKTGSRDASTTIATMLGSHPDLAKQTWKELTGLDNFTPFAPTPDRMLLLAGLPNTPENMKKAEEIFGTAKQTKEPSQIGSQVFMGVMYGALALQFFQTVALGEQGGGGH